MQEGCEQLDVDSTFSNSVQQQLAHALETLHGFEMGVGRLDKRWMRNDAYVPVVVLNDCMVLPQKGELFFTLYDGGRHIVGLRVRYEAQVQGKVMVMAGSLIHPEQASAFAVEYTMVQEKPRDEAAAATILAQLGTASGLLDEEQEELWEATPYTHEGRFTGPMGFFLYEGRAPERAGLTAAENYASRLGEQWGALPVRLDALGISDAFGSFELPRWRRVSVALRFDPHDGVSGEQALFTARAADVPAPLPVIDALVEG